MTHAGTVETQTARRQARFYYGWWIVGELAITETISYGVLIYAFSVFIAPMEAELGWSRSVITGAFSVAILMSGLAAFPVGWWLDRNGARLLMTAGATAATGLVLAWSRVASVPAYYAIWIGIGLTMATVLYEPGFAAVTQWFVRKRGRALSVVTFVAGFASTIFLPLANSLNEAYGWRSSVLILGILLGVTTIPLHGLILRRRPSDLGLTVDGEALPDDAPAARRINVSVSLSDALHHASFWWLTLSFGAATLASIAIRVHFIPLLLDRGFDAAFAAALAGLIGAMQVVGRVIFAPLEGRLSTRIVTAGIFFMQGVGLLILLFIQSTVGVYAFVAVSGASFGAATLARPSLVADFYGATYYGRISSVMAMFLTGAVTLGPVGAGLLYTSFGGSYEPVLWVLLGFVSVAFLAIWFLREEGGIEPA